MPQPFVAWEDNHLSDSALSQFQQGTLPSSIWLEADSHLATCEGCRMRLKQLLEGQGGKDTALLSLAQAFSRETIAPPLERLVPTTESSPTFEMKAAYVDGMLLPAERAAFETMMERAPSLAQEIADLRALKRELQTEESPKPVVGSQMFDRSTEKVLPARLWWERFLWPIHSLGTAAVAAILLFIVGISPLQQELRQQQAQQAQQEAGLQNQIAQAQRENLKYRTQSQRFQNRLEGQKRTLENTNQQLQRDLNALQNNLLSLNSQVEQQKNEMARLSPKAIQVAPTSGSAGQPSRTSSPIPNTPFITDGEGIIINQGKSYLRFEGAQVLSPEAVSALREGKLPSAPDLASLRSVATRVRGADKKFQVLSPVATKVRQVRPVLRWQKVAEATNYRVVLRDETAESFVYPSQLVTSHFWKVPDDLPRGRRFDWKVETYANQKLIGTAPQKPALAARFEVLSEAENEALEEKLKKAGSSALIHSLILARFGVQEEAQAKLSQLRQSR